MLLGLVFSHLSPRKTIRYLQHEPTSLQSMMEIMKEEKLIAASRLILRELDSNKKLSDDAIKILQALHARLASIAEITETNNEEDDPNEELSDINMQISSIHDKIMTWEIGQSMIWDSGSNEEIRRLIKRLESLNPIKNSKVHELLTKANDVFQISMAKIEEEFKHMLIHNRKNFELEDDELDDSSIFSLDDDSADDSIKKAGSEVYIMDLINPQIIPDLKRVANLMFDSNYSKECSQAFIDARKDALDDFLHVLVVEQTRMEDVLNMEFATLNFKIGKWTKALKIFVRVYLASEKLLCVQIFDQNESVSSFCLLESSKASILEFLSFAEAVAVGPHLPEKLPRILEIYEVLVDLTPDIACIYPDDLGLYLRTEFQDVVTQVGDCATSTFLEFKNAVRSNVSNPVCPIGGIHHLTRYVMNYVSTLVKYSNSLNYLLKDHGKDQDQDSSSSLNAILAFDDDIMNENACSSPTGLYLQLLMSILESNLEEKSRLYKEEALRHLFMMNNIHYMAEKVKGSDLRTVFGDRWIREHNWKFQHRAMSYERSTWSAILNLLGVEGLYDSGPISNSKNLLKDKPCGFYTGFEEIYKSQTGWSIPNSQLCEELKISVSVKVIPAYRTFVGRFGNMINVRNIKFTSDDLESYLLDLFEGSSKSLNSMHRK